MMAHPIHLHGHFFELVKGAQAAHQPLKHTLIVQPGSKATFDLTANEPGDRAFHCHLPHPLHAGMMTVVTVSPFPENGDWGCNLTYQAPPRWLRYPPDWKNGVWATRWV